MARTRIHDFGSPDSSELWNEKYRRLLTPGVYQGFNAIPGSSGLNLHFIHDHDVDKADKDSGADGATSAPAVRQFTSAGASFLTTVEVGDILIIADTGTDDDNGTYGIVSVDLDTQLTIDRDFPVGSLSTLDYRIVSARGLLYTPSGVTIIETACQFDVVTVPAAHPTNDRIDYVVATYTYNKSDPPNDVTFSVISGLGDGSLTPPVVAFNQIIIAEVLVPAASSIIPAGNIRNSLRPESEGLSEGQVATALEGLLIPGVRTGLELIQGSSINKVSVQPGGLLTQQYIRISETATAADAVTVPFTTTDAQYRFDWVVVLHRFFPDRDVEDHQYLLVQGTEVTEGQRTALPSDSDIVTAAQAVNSKYDSITYITKLGYVRAQGASAPALTVGYYNLDRVEQPHTLIVTDGKSDGSARYSKYVGFEGLIDALDDVQAFLETQGTGFVGQPYQVQIDGEIFLENRVYVPSNTAVIGIGAPTVLVTKQYEALKATGRFITRVAAVDTWQVQEDADQTGVPSGFKRYQASIDATYRTGDDMVAYRFLPGDPVHLYHPNSGLLDTGYWESYDTTYVNDAWSFKVIIPNTYSVSDTDVSVWFRKRNTEIRDLSVARPSGESNNASVQMAHVVRGRVHNVRGLRFEFGRNTQSTISYIKSELDVLSLSTSSMDSNFELGQMNDYRGIDVDSSSGEISLGESEERSHFTGLHVRRGAAATTLTIEGDRQSVVDLGADDTDLISIESTNSQFLACIGDTTFTSTTNNNIVMHVQGDVTFDSGAQNNRILSASGSVINNSGNFTNVVSSASVIEDHQNLQHTNGIIGDLNAAKPSRQDNGPGNNDSIILVDLGAGDQIYVEGITLADIQGSPPEATPADTGDESLFYGRIDSAGAFDLFERSRYTAAKNIDNVFVIFVSEGKGTGTVGSGASTFNLDFETAPAGAPANSIRFDSGEWVPITSNGGVYRLYDSTGLQFADVLVDGSIPVVDETDTVEIGAQYDEDLYLMVCTFVFDGGENIFGDTAQSPSDRHPTGTIIDRRTFGNMGSSTIATDIFTDSLRTLKHELLAGIQGDGVVYGLSAADGGTSFDITGGVACVDGKWVSVATQSVSVGADGTTYVYVDTEGDVLVNLTDPRTLTPKGRERFALLGTAVIASGSISGGVTDLRSFSVRLVEEFQPNENGVIMGSPVFGNLLTIGSTGTLDFAAGASLTNVPNDSIDGDALIDDSVDEIKLSFDPFAPVQNRASPVPPTSIIVYEPEITSPFAGIPTITRLVVHSFPLMINGVFVPGVVASPVPASTFMLDSANSVHLTVDGDLAVFAPDTWYHIYAEKLLSGGLHWEPRLAVTGGIHEPNYYGTHPGNPDFRWIGTVRTRQAGTAYFSPMYKYMDGRVRVYDIRTTSTQANAGSEWAAFSNLTPLTTWLNLNLRSLNIVPPTAKLIHFEIVCFTDSGADVNTKFYFAPGSTWTGTQSGGLRFSLRKDQFGAGAEQMRFTMYFDLMLDDLGNLQARRTGDAGWQLGLTVMGWQETPLH